MRSLMMLAMVLVVGCGDKTPPATTASDPKEIVKQAEQQAVSPSEVKSKIGTPRSEVEGLVWNPIQFVEWINTVLPTKKRPQEYKTKPYRSPSSEWRAGVKLALKHPYLESYQEGFVLQFDTVDDAKKYVDSDDKPVQWGKIVYYLSDDNDDKIILDLFTAYQKKKKGQ